MEQPSADSAQATQEITNESMREMARQVYTQKGYTEVPAQQAFAVREEFPQEVYDLAYMDLDKAEGQLKREILMARRKIAFSYDWGTEACVAVEWDDEAKTFSLLPSFEDLFPGWDVPNDNDLVDAPSTETVEENPTVSASDVQEASAASGSRINLSSPVTLWNNSTWVQSNTGTTNATDFYSINTVRSNVNYYEMDVLSMPASMATINLGFTNAGTGASLHSKRNLTLATANLAAFINPNDVSRIGFRTSTNSTSGSARVSVVRSLLLSA